MTKQQYVGYLYTPTLVDEVVRRCFVVLGSRGFSITNLGRRDPPKRWSGSADEAVTAVMHFEPNHISADTFLRSSELGLEITFTLHRDDRWDHDTISLSMPNRTLLRSLLADLSTASGTFLTILGVSGGGKQQDWDVVSMSDLCPPRLASLTSGQTT